MERCIQRSSRSRYVYSKVWVTDQELIHRVGPAHAVYFATYEAVKNAMGGNEGLHHEHHPLAAAVSGAAATIASDALMNPFDGTPQYSLHSGSTH
jgi:hypothetical protein